MVIEFGKWRIEPYQAEGKRCWQVKHMGDGGRFGRAMRYHDSLGGALAFCAEYGLRNDEEGVEGLEGAIQRYAAIRDSIRAVGNRLRA